MRHRVSGHHLGRAQDQRKAVLRALATELLRHEEIVTSLAKAKAVQPEVERIITKGKKGQLDDYSKTLKRGKLATRKPPNKRENPCICADRSGHLFMTKIWLLSFSTTSLLVIWTAKAATHASSKPASVAAMLAPEQ